MSYSETRKQIWKSLKFYLTISLFKIDVSFKTAGRFIDLETYIQEQDDEAFIKATVKPRIFWVKVPEKVKAYAIALYMIEANEIKEDETFTWIYNPPQFVNTGKVTQGSIEREAFAKTYGGYVEMVYLCCNQDPTKWEEIFNWETKKFLFLSSYLLRKKIVEGLD